MELNGVGDFIEQVRQEWKIPGLSIGVLYKGEVIFNKGFGQRNAEASLPATPDTLYAIGSTTKAFTAMGLALLVDEGRIAWDDPVRKHLPGFKMFDPYVTENMTVRDLLCHRSGLPRYDLMWYNSPYSREELFKRLQYLEPNVGFRSTWQYQNLMFMTAGYLNGVAAGTSWEDFITTRIFNTLGMENTNFSVRASQQSGDHALPYEERSEQIRAVPFRDISTVGPAGSINSSVNDMLRWLRVHLNQGKHEDAQFVSESSLKEMHTGHMMMPEMPALGGFPETLQSSYGLGWAITPYRGSKVIWHTGGIDGFSALVTFMPAAEIGIVILTNLGGTNAHQIIAYNIFDRLTGMELVNWNERFRKIADEMKANLQKAKEQGATDRVEGTQPSHPLKDYTGDYEHPGYGVFSVTLEGERLKGRINDIEWRLDHYHYDVFEMTSAEMEGMPPIKASFTGDLKGSIGSVTIPFEPTARPQVFTRMPDKSLMNRDFLEQFAGEYEVLGMTMTVALKGEDKLVASVPGQGDQELVPYQDTTFNLKGLTGFSITFKRDSEGKVREAVITQPGGTIIATRK